MTEQKESGRAVTVIGRVTSNKMNKTIVVEVDRKVKHPLYGKYMKHDSKMYADTGTVTETCGIGDLVLIKQSRPLSKTKHWILVEVLEKSNRGIAE